MSKRTKLFLTMVAMAITASLSMAQRPQKVTDKGHKVDFTVNYDVQSNYNTSDLRRRAKQKKPQGHFLIVEESIHKGRNIRKHH